MAAEPKSAEAKAEAKEAKARAKAAAEAEAAMTPTESNAPEVKPAEVKLVEVKLAEIKMPEAKAVELKIPEAKPKPVSKRPNAYPSEGYALEIDGKVKSEHASLESAQERGLALKSKYPVLQVVVYEAATKARTILELPA